MKRFAAALLGLVAGCGGLVVNGVEDASDEASSAPAASLDSGAPIDASPSVDAGSSRDASNDALASDAPPSSDAGSEGDSSDAATNGLPSGCEEAGGAAPERSSAPGFTPTLQARLSPRWMGRWRAAMCLADARTLLRRGAGGDAGCQSRSGVIDVPRHSSPSRSRARRARKHRSPVHAPHGRVSCGQAPARDPCCARILATPMPRRRKLVFQRPDSPFWYCKARNERGKIVEPSTKCADESGGDRRRQATRTRVHRSGIRSRERNDAPPSLRGVLSCQEPPREWHAALLLRQGRAPGAGLR